VLVNLKYNHDGSYKSSAEQFFTQHQLSEVALSALRRKAISCLILAGEEDRTRKAASELRLHLVAICSAFARATNTLRCG
jgi:aspartyl-tRNA synthetase